MRAATNETLLNTDDVEATAAQVDKTIVLKRISALQKENNGSIVRKDPVKRDATAPKEPPTAIPV
jgi:hypothetical protein